MDDDPLLKLIGYGQPDAHQENSTVSYHCKNLPIATLVGHTRAFVTGWSRPGHGIALPPLPFIGQSQLNVGVGWQETARHCELASDSNGR